MALLARLALAPLRDHPREELVELLWPGVALDVGRNRLRQTLSTLKSLIDTATPTEPLIRAGRHSIRLRPGAMDCDAVEFERLVRQGAMAEARSLYGGELLPGFYDEWVLEARAHFAALHDRVEAEPVAAAPLPAAYPLPASWTRVFGIELSASRLLSLLRHERLVTITGPGGCGKTRLALESARALRDMPPWLSDADIDPRTRNGDRFRAIAFVALTACHDEHQVLATLAHALHVTGRDLLQQIQARLSGAPALLVLDNFEQLVGTPAQGLLLSLLETLPSLHLLVTSRLRLGLPGEQVFVLRGLPLPDAQSVAAEATRNPAVALFVDRARAARADAPTATLDLAAICALVRLLDGMPLALELAASRVGSHSPAQMLALLSGGVGAHLQLLTRSGPRAGHDPRHASIADVIAWSWRLLNPDEQRLMAAVSTVPGDTGLPALGAMLGAPPATLAVRIDDLIGHSLLRVLTPPDGRQPMRVAVVEPVREFVLSQSPQASLAAFRGALQTWLTGWARSLGRSPSPGLVDLEFRSVMAALVKPCGPPAGTLELLLALRSHWESSGMPAVLQVAVEQVLQQHESQSGAAGEPLASEAHEQLAYLRFESGFVAEALSHADAALRLAGRDGARRARALVRRAWVDLAAGHGLDVTGTGPAGPQAWLDEALQLARAAGDTESEARALHQLAVLASNLRSNWAEAEVLLQRSQELWQSLGDHRKALARLRNLGQCWLRAGRIDDALRCFESCEQAAREDGDWVGQIDSLLSLSSLLTARRQWAAALEMDRRAVELCWQRWHRHGLAYALWNPSLALARLRQPEPAMRLMAFASTFWQSTFGPLAPDDRRTQRRVRRLVQAQVGQARAEALWVDGGAMAIPAAVQLVLTLRVPSSEPPPRDRPDDGPGA
jgi:predicted ATPase/tetratricopeptide (TPR) repeat protein